MSLKFRIKKLPPLVQFLLIFLGIFLFLYTSYSILVLSVQVSSAKKIARVKTVLEESRLNLSRNSLLYYRLLAFNPGSITFQEDKDTLLSQLFDANKNAIDYFSSPPSYHSTFWVNKDSKKIIQEVNKTLPGIFNEAKVTLSSQKDILEELKTSEDILRNIFEYDPRVDFANLDDLDQAAERANNAIVHIRKIEEKLKTSNLNGKDELAKSFDATLTQFSGFYAILNSKNTKDIKPKLDTLETSFSSLKARSFELQKNIVKSEKSLGLLVEEANQIGKFQNLIRQATSIQKNLNTDYLALYIIKTKGLLLKLLR